MKKIVVYVILVLAIFGLCCYYRHLPIATPDIETFTTTPTYIFWTGGYDSTYRLFDALINEHKTVQPVYLSGVIDNEPTKYHRKSVSQEQRAMETLREQFLARYPEYQQNFLPTQIVNQVTVSPSVKKAMERLKARNMVRRSTCQYGALSQYALNLQQPIELAVEHEPHSSIMYRAIYDKVVGQGSYRRINHKLFRTQPELSIYRNFRFPTLHLSKTDMLNRAKRSGFSDLLKNTWSCWYPVKGQPCGRCIMCRERIL